MSNLFHSWTPTPSNSNTPTNSSLFKNLPPPTPSTPNTPEENPLFNTPSLFQTAHPNPTPRPSLSDYAEHRNPLWDLMDAANVPPSLKFQLAARLQAASPSNPDPIWSPISETIRFCTQENLSIIQIHSLLHLDTLIPTIVQQQKNRTRTGVLSSISRRLAPSPSDTLHQLSKTISTLDTLHSRLSALNLNLQPSLTEIQLWASILPLLPQNPSTAHWAPHISTQTANFLSPLLANATSLSLSLQSLLSNVSDSLTTLRTLRCHAQP